MVIYNSVPHAVDIVDRSGDIVSIPPNDDGYVARLVGPKQQEVAPPPGDEDLQRFVFVERPTYTGIEGLPPNLQPGDIVIVSMLVAEYVTANPDAALQGVVFVVPDSGKEGGLRNERGQIVGSRRLVVYTETQ